MRRRIPALVSSGFIIFLALAARVEAQRPKARVNPKYDPPANLQPTEEDLKKIRAKIERLSSQIAHLHQEHKHAEALPDVEIFLRAAQNIVRFNEFYNRNSVKWTLDVLDRGSARAERLAKGETPWCDLKTANVVRGYRSRVDDTAQPYGVTFPLDYGKDRKKKWRVDLVLHGRGATLTEVSFLNSNSGNKKVEPEQNFVQIDAYGRGNNAYRWAGETDVLEAMGAFLRAEALAGRAELIDRKQIVLRGFSMGGAGTWHLGLHYPDKWCVMGPGAGFTTTHGYASGLQKPLPDYQEKCLRIYDAIDYVENSRMIPIVAYSGGDDPQKLAADNIEKRLKALQIPGMTHIVAPGLGHSFPPEWFKKVNPIWDEYARKGRPEYPRRISFVTYTLKYPDCEWIHLVALEKHYERTTVDAELTANGFQITTHNIRELRLNTPAGMAKDSLILIDGQEIKAKGQSSSPAQAHPHLEITLSRDGKKWHAITARGGKAKPGLRKIPGLQGPIDDAFASAFVCVPGSGEPWHPLTKKYVEGRLAAFKQDWAKHWRGELPTTGDYAVTPNDLKDKNLVLFGDPNSNLTLKQILPHLPLKWTADEIEFAGKTYKGSEHVPVLIFPNPLNPTKYVVLNTGHTFPSGDYNKTNAMLFARLGDYAILHTSTGSKVEVATAGLFDENWEAGRK